MTNHIQLTFEPLDSGGSLALLILNRPDKLNALTVDMLDGLVDAADEIEADTTCRVVVLAGAGERAFCVGADVHAWSALEPLAMWREWIVRGQRVFERVARLRQPTIAALHGYAYGGGLELALAADLRIAAEGTRLALPEVKLATVPGWAGTQRLPALIGVSRAKQMIFTGEPVEAEQAERWGLVNEVVAGEALMSRAREVAEQIAANAPVAVQVAKQLVDAQGRDAGLSLEALAGGLLGSTADGREGTAAFREKRSPVWTGV